MRMALLTPTSPAEDTVSAEATHRIVLAKAEPEKMAGRDAGVAKILQEALRGMADVLQVSNNQVLLKVTGNSAEVRHRVMTETGLPMDALKSQYQAPASNPLDAFEVTDDVNPANLKKLGDAGRRPWKQVKPTNIFDPDRSEPEEE
jgi:hypothetical protein